MGSCQSCLDKVGRSIGGSIEPKGLINLTDLNALKVTNVEEFYNRNTSEHYTQLYEYDEFGKQRSSRLLSRLTSSNREPKKRPLILRRGQAFELKISFNREFRKGEDLINLVFNINDAVTPKYSDGTQVIVILSDENMNSMIGYNDMNNWYAYISKIDDNSIIVEVASSVNALIGEYRLSIDIKTKTGYNSFELNTKIIMLFNAWNKKDVCYLRSREARQEYILNENGVIFRGTHSSIRPTTWEFSTFSEDVLECTLYLLEYVGNLPISERSNPIKVARHLSEIINDANGYGVLKGNWTEDFRNGRAPSSWLNSREILSQYLQTKKPVNYAQCWNFAGVLCTCLRTLGIASRIVTCYMAAHDTEGSLTIDRVLNDKLEHLKDKSADSVWNFHNFCEIWIKRPDLDVNGRFDGWQVVDSTPQQPSDNLYRCGPSSVVAIKAGLVQSMFDTKFVYAEVNADEVFWLYKDRETPLKLIQTNTEEIGKLIITKSIGSNDYDDITSNYKEHEGSKKERETMLRALKSSSSDFARYYLNAQFTDVIFELKVLDNAIIGKDFKVRLIISNKSEQIYTIEAVFAIRSTNYANRIQNLIKRVTQEKKIQPLADDEMIIPVTFDEYSDYLFGDNTFNISVLANVKESTFNYISMIDFRFRLPDIKIDIEGDIIRGKPFYVRAHFLNPLPSKLTNGSFMISGPGLDKTLVIKLNRAVNANEEASCNFTLTPKTVGEKVINIKFSSNLLKDVDGFKNIKVSPNLNDITLHDEDFY